MQVSIYSAISLRASRSYLTARREPGDINNSSLSCEMPGFFDSYFIWMSLLSMKSSFTVSSFKVSVPVLSQTARLTLPKFSMTSVLLILI